MPLEAILNNIALATKLTKALSNEKRLQIVCALSSGEKCVGQLEDIVGLSQSALSQHLARLRRDNVVSTRREAQTIHYSLRCERVKSVLECLSGLYDT